jgi:hypothetical protein
VTAVLNLRVLRVTLLVSPLYSADDTAINECGGDRPVTTGRERKGLEKTHSRDTFSPTNPKTTCPGISVSIGRGKFID